MKKSTNPKSAKDNSPQKGDIGQLDAAEIFLSIQEKDATLETWEKYQSHMDLTPSNEKAQDALNTFWRDAESLSADLMPSAKELSDDIYNGGIPIEDFLARTATNTEKREEKPFKHFVSFLVALIHTPLRQPAFAGAATALLVAISVIFWSIDSKITYSTGISEHQRFVLEDGSSILLGARSEIHVEFTDNLRQISLIDGEGFFEVAKNPARPFIVETGTIAVQAVGTAFNILSTPDTITISVTEGIVEVKPSETNGLDNAATEHIPQTTLVVGHELSVAIDSKTFTRRTKLPEKMVSWQQKTLFFSGEPLRNIVHRIDRYTPESIVLQDSNVGGLLFSGSVSRDNIDGWLKSLPLVFPVTVKKDSGKIIIASTETQ